MTALAPQAAPPILIELQARENRPQPCPLYLDSIELLSSGTSIQLPLDEQAFDEQRGSHLQKDPGSWGDPTTWEGRRARPFLNFGSPFHKVVGAFVLPPEMSAGHWSVRMSYWSAVPCEVRLRLYVESQMLDLGLLPLSNGEWTQHVVEVSAEMARTPISQAEAVNVSGINGTGAVAVDEVQLVNRAGQPVHVVEHGEPVSFVTGLGVSAC